ncbi:hypothetical protein ACFQ38_16360 [Sporosarcina contaminans]|uniref:Uncharacterized protein n=1 Tax=Sporosarcina contaminans TaxID=633403 RepID=A0ABW3U0V7_9BACL
MTKKFLIRRYNCKPEEMEVDMNDLYNEGYYPKEIKLDDYQDMVDATVIYELEGDSNA